MIKDLESKHNIDQYQLGIKINQNRKKTYVATNKETNENVIIQHVNSFEAAPMFSDYNKFHFINYQGFVNIKNIFFYPKSENSSVDEKDQLYIVYEKMKNGNICFPLRRYLETKGRRHKKMNPTIRNKIIYGVCSSVYFGQKKKIPFKELNPTNIYLDDNLEPKISIGTSIYNYTNFWMTCKSQNAIFIPPEFDKKGKITDKSDVYSFGVFLYLMFVPNVNLNNKELIKIDTIPDVYWELITKCTKENPDERPTIKDILSELKDDKFLLEEFGMKANPSDVHEYQKKIEFETEIKI